MKELHPLLTEGKNKHYVDKHTGKAHIYSFEEDYTVNEMLAWCRITIEKYSVREKGQDKEDFDKRNKYMDYKNELYKLKSYGLGEMIVMGAWKTSSQEWRYTDEN